MHLLPHLLHAAVRSAADEPLRDAFARETAAFAKAVPLWETLVEPVEIPFENGPTLPGVLALRG